MSIPDGRHISNGWEIPTEHYSDQPYVVKTDDGAWLCVLTTGAGVEGASGQHVVTLRSTDKGRTWSKPVDVEPAGGPEASYAVLLKAPDGRVFCFYNHNTDNLRQVIADNPPYADGLCRRVDSLGYLVCKYSDDHGRTWSAQRYPIPMREMDIDRRNAYGGAVRFFWNVGRPFIHVDQDQGKVINVCLNLPPDFASGTTAGRPYLFDRHAHFPHDLEAVAHAVGDALENGSRHVRPGVPQAQADKRAPGIRILMRSALAGEIRQKD